MGGGGGGRSANLASAVCETHLGGQAVKRPPQTAVQPGRCHLCPCTPSSLSRRFRPANLLTYSEHWGWGRDGWRGLGVGVVNIYSFCCL